MTETYKRYRIKVAVPIAALMLLIALVGWVTLDKSGEQYAYARFMVIGGALTLGVQCFRLTDDLFTVLTAGSDQYSPDHPGMKWVRTFQVAGIRECLGHTRDSHSQTQPCGQVWACKLPLVEHPRLGVPDRY